MRKPVEFRESDLPLVVKMREQGVITDTLARWTGFHPRTIDNWTSRARRPTPGQRAILAEALCCDPDDLIDPNPRPHQRPTNPQRRPMGTSGTLAATNAARTLWAAANGTRDSAQMPPADGPGTPPTVEPEDPGA